ncbi:MAG: large-conductance mechanosensitive channel protein MscL [Candidatus Gastranaerophilales bacterium]|nr:large-conductance mechanosensitive channel protein MscL [Candidatus Gastranaerophilales bacterium]
MLDCLKKNLDEFKTFAMRGNVIDMAVGIIIGAAFGKIVDSLVKDVIMPPLGMLMSGVDFTNLYITLPNKNGEILTYESLEQAQAAGAITINYGIFINTVISFILVAFAVFMMIKFINKLKDTAAKEEAQTEEATTKTCPKCFSSVDIRATRCPHCTSEIE